MHLTIRLLSVLSLFAASAAVASARIERTVEKTFDVASAGTLDVETHGGSVRVAVGTGNVVKVVALQKIRADSDAEADELLKDLVLVIEQEGNDVHVHSKYDRKPGILRWTSWPPVQVDFTITVPAAFAADINTSGGGITVGDLQGKLEVRTSGGGIKLGRLGNTVQARTSGGGISLEAAGGSVELRTSGGSITAGRIAGPAALSTSGGSIRIESVEGALRASTSGGSIRATIAGPLREECVLSTSGGGITVHVDKSAAFELDASASGGGVDVAGMTVVGDDGGQVRSRRSRMAGAVNGGGPLLKLRTSGGGVNVSAR